MKSIERAAVVLVAVAIWLGGQAVAQQPAATEITSDQTGAYLLPEGYLVQGRQAKLVRSPAEDRWFLVFEELDRALNGQPAFTANGPGAQSPEETSLAQGRVSEPNRPAPFAVPIEVLPGRWLSAMTSAVGETTDYSVDFRVWGEITTYHGRNYILPSYVGTVSLFGRDRQGASTEERPESPLGRLMPGRQEPQGAEPEGEVGEQAMPDRLGQMLRAIPRTRPLGLPESREVEAAAPVIGPAEGSGPAGWQGGEMVVDRVGRLRPGREGGAWSFHFDAGEGNVAEPPLLLHPSRLVEFMETAAREALGPVRFRVSGQVTQSEGQGYLLLRKAVLTYSSDNLGS